MSNSNLDMIWQNIEDTCRAEGYSEPQLDEEGKIWAYKGNSPMKTRVESPQILRLEAQIEARLIERLEARLEEHKRGFARASYLIMLVFLCLAIIPMLAGYLEDIVTSTSSFWSTAIKVSSSIKALYLGSSCGVGVYFLLVSYSQRNLNSKHVMQGAKTLAFLGVMAIAIQSSLLLLYRLQ